MTGTTISRRQKKRREFNITKSIDMNIASLTKWKKIVVKSPVISQGPKRLCDLLQTKLVFFMVSIELKFDV